MTREYRYFANDLDRLPFFLNKYTCGWNAKKGAKGGERTDQTERVVFIFVANREEKNELKDPKQTDFEATPLTDTFWRSDREILTL